jgi:hypothetical protein
MLAAVFDRATEGDTGGISKLGSPPVFELHFKLGSKIPNPYGKSSRFRQPSLTNRLHFRR